MVEDTWPSLTVDNNGMYSVKLPGTEPCFRVIDINDRTALSLTPELISMLSDTRFDKQVVYKSKVWQRFTLKFHLIPMCVERGITLTYQLVHLARLVWWPCVGNQARRLCMLSWNHGTAEGKKKHLQVYLLFSISVYLCHSDSCTLCIDLHTDY